MKLSTILFGTALATAALAHPALAGYTTVDIQGYVNSNVAINASTYPTGLSTGNKGLGIPFQIAQYPSGSNVEGTWNSGGGVGSTLDVSLGGLGITGQATFYALLNNYYGTPGADEYDITIKATDGTSVTYQSIGGVDTRDYNANVFTNTIASTTTEWFNNGIGQRFDVRAFVLPAAFATLTISDFIVTQVQPGDAALFSGLTFSNEGLVFGVPEPASLAVLGIGAFALAGVRRRRAQ
jgi:hypothetical protein